MKLRKILIPVLALATTFSLVGCKEKEATIEANTYTNIKEPFEYDNLGGGKEGVTPTVTTTNSNYESVDNVVKTLSKKEITDYDLESAKLFSKVGLYKKTATIYIKMKLFSS